jgi:uncharacterized protein YyaL (SSP411 family)
VPDRVPELLDQKITQIRDHLEKLKAIREMMHLDPSIVTVLNDLLLSPAANGKVVAPRKRQQAEEEKVKRIVEFLRAQPQDQWLPARAIAQALSIDKTLIYDLLPELFEVTNPTPKRKAWRLKR